MIIYLYRWKLHADKEQNFIKAWSYITAQLREKCGTYGSRLHRGDDGIWYAYAQWPSREKRAQAKLGHREIIEAREMMKDATLEGFPEVELEPLSDFLILP